MSRRASLPGADELFRRTSSPTKASEAPAPVEKSTSKQVAKSTNLQVADTEAKKPKHEEKITFYCTPEDLVGLERARLTLRSEHGVAADRGKIVRAALAYVLEDFDARASDSILLRTLQEK